jgi:hypothetical protein
MQFLLSLSGAAQVDGVALSARAASDCNPIRRACENAKNLRTFAIDVNDTGKL